MYALRLKTINNDEIFSLNLQFLGRRIITIHNFQTGDSIFQLTMCGIIFYKIFGHLCCDYINMTDLKESKLKKLNIIPVYITQRVIFQNIYLAIYNFYTSTQMTLRH